MDKMIKLTVALCGMLILGGVFILGLSLSSCTSQNVPLEAGGTIKASADAPVTGMNCGGYVYIGNCQLESVCPPVSNDSGCTVIGFFPPEGTMTPIESPAPTLTPTMVTSQTPTPLVTVTATSGTMTPDPTATPKPSPSGTTTPDPTDTPTSVPTDTPTVCPGMFGISLQPLADTYKQFEGGWQDDPMPFQAPLRIGVNDIGHIGCYLTCLSMIVGRNPGVLDQLFSNPRALAIDAGGGMHTYQACPTIGLSPLLFLPPVDDGVLIGAMKDQQYVSVCLEKDLPTSCLTHYVLVTGQVADPTTGDCEFIIQDPGSNHTRYLSDYYQRGYYLSFIWGYSRQ